jgi:hypothetical protein
MNCRLKNSFGVSHEIVDQNTRSRSAETVICEDGVGLKIVSEAGIKPFFCQS